MSARRSDATSEQLTALCATIQRPADPAKGDNAARLAALGAELKCRGLDEVVVPRAEEYQGEYVPLHDSGSA